jgi:thiosulfate dehydrogenase
MLGLAGFHIGGAGPILMHDSRDNQDMPVRGWYTNLNYLARGAAAEAHRHARVARPRRPIDAERTRQGVTMRGLISGVVLTLVVLCGGAYLAASLGWIPVGADNAPGMLERRLANMATDAYVERHAPNQENPFKPTAENLSDGAREYEMHCSLCHGGAADRISKMQAKFSPPVPQLIDRIPDDPDANLFWIAKHGIRMTGMPGWDRVMTDEDIWKVILFVKHSDKLPPDALKAWKEAAGPM